MAWRTELVKRVTASCTSVPLTIPVKKSGFPPPFPAGTLLRNNFPQSIVMDGDLAKTMLARFCSESSILFASITIVLSHPIFFAKRTDFSI